MLDYYQKMIDTGSTNLLESESPSKDTHNFDSNSITKYEAELIKMKSELNNLKHEETEIIQGFASMSNAIDEQSNNSFTINLE